MGRHSGRFTRQRLREVRRTYRRCAVCGHKRFGEVRESHFVCVFPSEHYSGEVHKPGAHCCRRCAPSVIELDACEAVIWARRFPAPAFRAPVDRRIRRA